METAALADSKEDAAKQGRTIVFIDESGLSQRPHRCRTWAPRGQTPVLQFHSNWKKLSAVAGVTWWNFYFRLFPGAIRAPQVIEFLPAYAPELNPVEYLWGYWKQHELPNFCPTDYAQLSGHARRALRRIQRRLTLVTAFWKQAELFWSCHYIV